MEFQFSKLDNFRDLGEIHSGDGRTIKPKRLLRSGELSNLTTEDIRILREEYHVVNVVDLRTENERKSSPDKIVPGACHIDLDFFPGEAAKQADCSEDQLGKMQNVEQMHENMLETYRSFIEDEHVRKSLYEFLKLLLETKEGGTLFHCYAGKDRTGISAAVILTVLGVSKEDIVRDYLETNVLREEINHTIIEYLRDAGQPENVLEAVHAGLCVEQRYLETAFETADKKYGSFENYILQGIGFEPEGWEELRLMYLE